MLNTDTSGTTLTCTATSAGGTGSGTITVKLDTTKPSLAPTLSSLQPVLLGSSLTVKPNASDATSVVLSGSASCGTPDTTQVGTRTVTCKATDNAGNTQTTQVSYTVTYPFTGFAQPVNNLPTVNTVKAGSAVPMKFSLGSASSLGVLAAGYPKITPVACSATGPTDEIETTLPMTNNSGLTYSAGMYTYVWKTPSTAGCYQVNVRLKDNTDHVALFKLR